MATRRRCKSCSGKKVIVGGTALELGDRFSVPNGVIVSGPVLQTLAAESMLQNRTLHWTSTHRHADRACPARIDHAVLMAPPLRRQAGGDAARNGRRHRSRRAFCCRQSSRSFSTPRCFTSRSSSTSPPSRSTKSTSGICSAGSPRTAFSASRCRSATAWSAPIPIT